MFDSAKNNLTAMDFIEVLVMSEIVFYVLIQGKLFPNLRKKLQGGRYL